MWVSKVLRRVFELTTSFEIHAVTTCQCVYALLFLNVNITHTYTCSLSPIPYTDTHTHIQLCAIRLSAIQRWVFAGTWKRVTWSFDLCDWGRCCSSYQQGFTLLAHILRRIYWIKIVVVIVVTAIADLDKPQLIAWTSWFDNGLLISGKCDICTVRVYIVFVTLCNSF